MAFLKTVLAIACAIIVAVIALNFLFYLIPIVIVLYAIHIIHRTYNPKVDRLRTYNRKNNLRF